MGYTVPTYKKEVMLKSLSGLILRVNLRLWGNREESSNLFLFLPIPCEEEEVTAGDLGSVNYLHALLFSCFLPSGEKQLGPDLRAL